jgi:large subunit ribosomal protein L31
MKPNIHPKWYTEAEVVCACGNVFTVGSTKSSFRVEICSKCHPFYTGEMKFVDTLGRVEKFQKRQATAQTTQAKIGAKKKKIKEEKEERKPRSLREMLLGTN